MNTANISEAIQQWDGRSSADISAIYNNYSEQEGFVEYLVDLLDDELFQKGTSWLLKHHVEERKSLDENLSSRIIYCLNGLSNCEAKLHLLQITDYIVIPKKDKGLFEKFVRKSLTDNNKLVRAWAYNGFYILAMQFPEYQQEAKSFFKMAMNDEVASVKARIRNILSRNSF